MRHRRREASEFRRPLCGVMTIRVVLPALPNHLILQRGDGHLSSQFEQFDLDVGPR